MYVRSLCGVFHSEVRCGDDRGDPRWTWPTVAGTEGAARLYLSDGLGCAIREDGSVSCWGASSAGVLGEAEPVDRDDAVTIAGLPPVSDLALGVDFACALAMDRTVWCWGHRNTLADGAPVTFAVARPIAPNDEL
ncbi:MAG: hypothetical protein M5U28_11990 [Sandaracinaceae bacterium]|nr:hypothetical protein [Sandaracinaceae bacterium]